MKHITLKQLKSKAYFILRVMRSIYSLNASTRMRITEELRQEKDVEYIKNHPQPTGVCDGCGKDMYNGENICSSDCADTVEVQMWGYCAQQGNKHN